ncbi:MAG: hypothetical protein LBQ35_05745, partial [Spirochaetaceae bacterium]|nr:hypothetical protein [Spirochaetaceae bacterium]
MMKSKIFVSGIVSLALMFGLVLAVGCEDPNGPPPGDDVTTLLSGLENGAQVYLRVEDKESTTPYTGNGTVKIRIWRDGFGYDLLPVPAGTVTNGKLTLDLPATVDDQYLEPIRGLDPGVSVNPSDVKILDGGLVLVEGETVLAEIGLSRETESASDYIGYMYFSKAVSVTGT